MLKYSIVEKVFNDRYLVGKVNQADKYFLWNTRPSGIQPHGFQFAKKPVSSYKNVTRIRRIEMWTSNKLNGAIIKTDNFESNTFMNLPCWFHTSGSPVSR